MISHFNCYQQQNAQKQEKKSITRLPRNKVKINSGFAMPVPFCEM